jgi:hypothetical protein
MAADPQSEFTNSILVCVDCGEEFVFTASAQKYFAERGFIDPPKRCRTCYNAFKNGGGTQTDAGESPLPPPGLDEGPRPRVRS